MIIIIMILLNPCFQTKHVESVHPLCLKTNKLKLSFLFVPIDFFECQTLGL